MFSEKMSKNVSVSLGSTFSKLEYPPKQKEKIVESIGTAITPLCFLVAMV